MYVNSLACVRVKGVRQGCIMSLWLFNVYIHIVMKEVKMGMGRREEWRLPGLLYVDDLVLCGLSEEDLREMVG